MRTRGGSRASDGSLGDLAPVLASGSVPLVVVATAVAGIVVDRTAAAILNPNSCLGSAAVLATSAATGTGCRILSLHLGLHARPRV